MALQRGQAVERVAPEVTIVGKSFKRGQEKAGLGVRMCLAKRCLQFLYQVTEPDRVLPVLGMGAVGWLVK
jgi:hypothetical protein